MKYFIGVVPPEEIYNAIVDIQQRFGDNRLEPHITIRAPVTPVSIDAWLHTVDTVCSSYHSFDVHLPATGRFGKRVLFVDVKSRNLDQLSSQLIKAIKPFEPIEKDDGRSYHPHLTLGRSWCGFTSDDFNAMQELTENILSPNGLSFVAKSIRIYWKPGHSKRYETFKDVVLL